MVKTITERKKTVSNLKKHWTAMQMRATNAKPVMTVTTMMVKKLGVVRAIPLVRPSREPSAFPPPSTSPKIDEDGGSGT